MSKHAHVSELVWEKSKDSDSKFKLDMHVKSPS